MSRSLTAYLPAPMRVWLDGRLGVQKIMANTGWLFADKIVRLGMGLVVGAWVARYLGPDRFGALNYAIAFVSLFAALGNLGLDSVVVRELVRNPASQTEVLGTAFSLKLIGGIVTLVVTGAVAGLVRSGDYQSRLLVAIVAGGTIFQAFDVVDFWFQSRIQAKYTVWARNCAFLLISLVKLLLIWQRASLFAFAWAGLAEIGLGAVGLIGAYRLKGQSLAAWRVSAQRARMLFSDSWPLLISGFAIGLFMRFNVVFLNATLGNRSVGVYSAALRISEMWYIIPTAIVSSVFPSIIEAKRTNEELYRRRLQKLFNLMTGLGYAVAIPLALLSGWIISVLYGYQYSAAGPVLAIQAWTSIFVFLGCAHAPFWLAENQQKLVVGLTFISAFLSIGLSYLLVPRFQEMGAAIATLVSYGLSNTLALCLFKRARPLFRITMRAIISPFGGIYR
jgi:PST family polysaccharide transporter